MVKATSCGLANCYVPAPATGTTATATTASLSEFSVQKLLQQRSSGDGSNVTPLPSRGPLALRRLVLETSILSQATGSALVELGHTKVLCQVHGPLSATESSNTISNISNNSNNNNMDEGVLACHVRLAPNLGIGLERIAATQVASLDQYHTATLLSAGKQSNIVMARETHLASQLYTALASAVPLASYPKCQIVVHVVVLQDDGNVLSAIVTAASLALADACIEMNDLVTCCRVALLLSSSSKTASKTTEDWTILADPDQAEEDASTAMVTLCLLPNWKQVTLWEQSGRMTTIQLQQAMELCRDGCRTLHRLMRTSLIAESSQLS